MIQPNPRELTIKSSGNYNTVCYHKGSRVHCGSTQKGSDKYAIFLCDLSVLNLKTGGYKLKENWERMIQRKSLGREKKIRKLKERSLTESFKTFYFPFLQALKKIFGKLDKYVYGLRTRLFFFLQAIEEGNHG